jgi:electron transfer flavoprotein beta subunit
MLKIVVCVKQVPDSAATVTVVNGKVTWGDAPIVINPWDEYAVEAALRLAEVNSGEVIAVSIGGEAAKEALKHSLAMGCSSAVLVNDPALAGMDSAGVARVLAAAVKKVGGVDMVFFGKQAIDTDTGITAAMAARVLGWPAMTLLSAVTGYDAGSQTLKGERAIEEGRQMVECKLPAVLSIVKDYGEPRYPSFMGIRKASKAVIPEWKAGDLGIEPPAPVVSWSEIKAPPVQEITNEIITGSSPQEIAAALADKIIQEKVL